MRPRRPLGACALVAVAALVAPSTSALAGPEPADTVEHAVGVRVLELVDDARPTPADPEGQRGPIPAAPARALPTTVFYPAVGDPPSDPAAEPVPDAEPRRGRHPVILFSHGAPGTPHDYRRMLTRWASQGYVVVAPQYPITSTAGPTDVAWTDARDQIRDARHVLSEVLALDRVPWSDGGLGRRLDDDHVAAAGHSMGGLTTLALVSECCRDRRVDAALVLAGVSDPEVEAGLRIVRPGGPILFAHATLDLAVSFANATRAFRHASTPKYLLEIRLPIGGIAGHILPFSTGFGRISDDVAAVIDDFLAAYLEDDPAAAERIAPGTKPGQDLRLRSDP